jgi:hypothetical protein
MDLCIFLSNNGSGRYVSIVAAEATGAQKLRVGVIYNNNVLLPVGDGIPLTTLKQDKVL